jgi:hypothetical protein
LNKECPEGPGSFSLNPNGGGTNYYKGPHKMEKTYRSLAFTEKTSMRD